MKTTAFLALMTDALQDVIHEVDPSRFQEKSVFSTPGTEPCGITFDGTALWLTDRWYQSTYRLDTAGNVIGSFSIPNENRWGLEWMGDGMWTSSEAAMLAFYTPSGRLVATEELTRLPAGTEILDIAISSIKLFASSGVSPDPSKSDMIYILERRASHPDGVRICHVPRGNPDNAHVRVVSESEVLAHLAHGDCFVPADATPGAPCDCRNVR